MWITRISHRVLAAGADRASRRVSTRHARVRAPRIKPNARRPSPLAWGHLGLPSSVFKLVRQRPRLVLYVEVANTGGDLIVYYPDGHRDVLQAYDDYEFVRVWNRLTN